MPRSGKFTYWEGDSISSGYVVGKVMYVLSWIEEVTQILLEKVPFFHFDLRIEDK